jgi:hypothetical protein
VSDITRVADLPTPKVTCENTDEYGHWYRLSTTVDGVIIHTWNKIEKEAATNA